VIRSRARSLIALAVVVLLGLASRRFADALPAFIAAYAGDALWALAAFLGIGLLFPRWSTARVAATALLFALLVELSQLYHAPWIAGLRQNALGGLILGFGFLWSDLACYAVGIACGAVGEALASNCQRSVHK